MKRASVVGLAFCSVAFASGSRAGDVSAPKAEQPSKASHCDSRAGFAALVGTDTCVKIGGRIRADYLSSTFKLKSVSGPAPGFGQGAAPIRHGGFATSAEVDIDTRTPTDFGTVRTYVRLRAVNDPNGIYSPQP